jgi:hypothetical protein
MLSSRPSSRIQPLYVTFLVHSWSNNCYLGFQIAVLVALRAAHFEAVANRNCAVTAAVSNRVCESVPFKRACIERSSYVPGGRQTEGYSEMRCEKFSNPAKIWVQ